jgi:hypothetical protein
MRLAVFLGAVTIALFFVIIQVADGYGPKVGNRFLERDPDYSAESLRTWVTSAEDASNARHYAIPVLFPLDLMFMFALGGFLACGSVACAQSIALLRNVAWLFAILPGLYVAADLLEDSLLARLLLNADNITDGAVNFAKAVTAVKLNAAKIAILQTIAIGAASLVFK